MLGIESEDFFMKQALLEAQKAFEADEVPVGAVIVCEGQIIARAHNQCEKLNDVTAHAEMLALTSAFDYLGSKVLSACTLYVTLEPCAMCAGAIFWARPKKLVWGAHDQKRGFSRLQPPILHPTTDFYGGLMADSCGEILKAFFRPKR